MNEEFWIKKWEEGQTRFHQEKYNKFLEQNHRIKQMAKIEGINALVPLCGKSLDMVYLAQLGYKVFGVELSKLAITQFINENELEGSWSKDGDFEVFENENYKLFVGDYFKFTKKYFDFKVFVVYDRACLVALDTAMRKRYYSHMQALCAGSRGHIHLSTLVYDQSQMDGPPFSVLFDEVELAYAKWARSIEIAQIDKWPFRDEDPDSPMVNNNIIYVDFE